MIWPRPKTVLVVAILSSLVRPNVSQGQNQPAAHDKGSPVGILGCLDPFAENYSKDLILNAESGDDYRLTGATKDLSKYLGGGIRVEGTKDESTTPLPTLHVTSFKKIPRKAPRLSLSFSNPVTWRVETDPKYGLNFSYPLNFSALPDSEKRIDPSFMVQTGTVPLRQLKIPDAIYPETNFAGGYFGIFVNTAINNREKCEQFAASQPGKRSSFTVRGIRYAVSVDGYVGSGYYDLHTFQSGLCYEFAFSLEEARTTMEDLGCMVPFLTDEERWKIVRRIISKVTFARPDPSSASAQTAILR